MEIQEENENLENENLENENLENENYIKEAEDFLKEATKNNRGLSKEIKWAIRNEWHSKEKLIDFLKKEMQFDYNEEVDDTQYKLSKKLIDIVYNYSIERIKTLYNNSIRYFGEDYNEYIEYFNDILNYIWGYLRKVYNAYRREHTLCKQYKIIKYNFNIIREKLIQYIIDEYNPDYNELNRIIDEYIEDFDNYDIYNNLENYIKNRRALSIENLTDRNLYNKLIVLYKEIIIDIVEEHNRNN